MALARRALAIAATLGCLSCGSSSSSPSPALSLSSSRLLVARGSVGSVAVSATGLGGDATIAVTGLPTGASAAPLTIPAGSVLGTLRIAVAGTALPGASAQATITAASGGSSASATLQLLVGGSSGAADASFATGGFGTANVSTVDSLNAIGLHSDGTFVGAGNSGANASTHHDVLLTRYTADGLPDSTFGAAHNGTATLDLGGDPDRANALAIDSNGKTVIAGISSYRFCVARLNQDGTLDTTFHGTGKYVAPFGDVYSIATAVTLAPDGKILAAGYVDVASGNYSFAVARFQIDGSLDTSFGPDHDGLVTVDMGTPADQANAVALQSDGKILLVGLTFNGAIIRMAMARLAADGSLDSSFAGSGKVVLPFSSGMGIDYLDAVALQSDGLIVAAGTSASEMAVVRLLADGTPDSTFGTSGLATTNFGVTARANAVALQPDGRIVIAGLAGTNIALARLTYFGAMDSTFGTSGTMTSSAGSFQTMVLDPFGRLLVAGYSGTNSSSDILIARLWP